MRASLESLNKSAEDDSSPRSEKLDSKRPISMRHDLKKIDTVTGTDNFADQMFSSTPPPSRKNSLYSIPPGVVAEFSPDAANDNHYTAVSSTEEEKLNHKDDEKIEHGEEVIDVDNICISSLNATELELAKQELREMRESISSVLTAFLERCDSLQRKLESL